MYVSVLAGCELCDHAYIPIICIISFWFHFLDEYQEDELIGISIE